MLNQTILLRSLMIVAFAGALAGCVIAPPAYHYHADVVYPEVAPTPVIANTPPPPALVEVRSAMPVPGYIWVDGVWLWETNHHVWHGGHWQSPKPGYVWIPHRWHQEGNEWHMDGGHWRHS